MNESGLGLRACSDVGLKTEFLQDTRIELGEATQNVRQLLVDNIAVPVAPESCQRMILESEFKTSNDY